MFEKAISYPLTGEKAVSAFVIGSLLTLLSVLLLPGLLVFGYLMRILRQPADADADVPGYDEWGTLLVDGLKATLITIGYFVVPALVALVVAVAVFASFTTVTVVESGSASGVTGPDGVIVDSQVQSTGPDAVTAVVLVVSLLFLLLSAVWSLAALYVLPAGLAHFARTGRMGSAFAVRRFWPVLTSGTYLVAWLLALAVSFATGFVIGFVSILPGLGVLLGFVLAYYAAVVAARLYGQGYANATSAEDGPEPPAGQPAA
jgi:hypothetical protein